MLVGDPLILNAAFYLCICLWCFQACTAAFVSFSVFSPGGEMLSWVAVCWLTWPVWNLPMCFPWWRPLLCWQCASCLAAWQSYSQLDRMHFSVYWQTESFCRLLNSFWCCLHEVTSSIKLVPGATMQVQPLTLPPLC